MTSPHDRPFRIHVGPYQEDELWVDEFSGREAISQPYAFEVALTTKVGWNELHREVFGKGATLTIHGGETRFVHGIVSAIERRGVRSSSGRHEYGLTLVPKLWLLSQNRNSRIFQDVTVRQMVEALLSPQGIALRWSTGTILAKRNYCLQYEESDLSFLERVLSQHGLFYFFRHPKMLFDSSAEGPPGEPPLTQEVVVVGDSPADYLPIPAGAFLDASAPKAKFAIPGALDLKTVAAVLEQRAAGGAGVPTGQAPSLSLRHESGRLDEEVITRFRITRQMRPTRLEEQEYHYGRPNLDYSGRATVEPSVAGGGAVGMKLELATAPGKDAMHTELAAPGDASITVYDHRPEFQEPGASPQRARERLEQERADALVGVGAGTTTRLAPGYKFTLDGGANADLVDEYAVTEILHRGAMDPKAVEASKGSEGRESLVYSNTFMCVPSRVAARPKLVRAGVQQVIESGRVVGPSRLEGDVFTDGMGRIKVHFPWDREHVKTEHASCWIRTTQAWAGRSWGIQFTPRVGMEVMVGFLGGDADRPVILGAAYNATHPVPFPLPGTRNGIRTRSTGILRGELPEHFGHNELSFEDQVGQEQIYLHAERDLDEVVLRNHTLKVHAEETIDIRKNRVDHIHQNLTLVVDMNRTETIGLTHTEGIGVDKVLTVGQDRKDEIGRDLTLKVHKNRHENVGADYALRVEGNYDRHIEASALDFVGGNFSRTVRGTESVRVEGAQSHYVAGNAEHEFASDYTTRIGGCLTTIVGKADAKRSWLAHAEGVMTVSGGEQTEIISDKEIVLRVAKNWLRIGKKGIEMSAGFFTLVGGGGSISTATGGLQLAAYGDGQFTSKGNMLLKAKAGGSVKLTADAVVDGAKVMLKAPPGDADDIVGVKNPLTTISLVDGDGKAVPFARWVIVTDSGQELSGFTDEEGISEIVLHEGGEIHFPEMGKARGKDEPPPGPPAPEPPALPDPPAPNTIGPASIAIRVVDTWREEGGSYDPVSGATVTLEGPARRMGTTDSAGWVTFEGIPSGTYAIRAEKSGYVIESGTAEARAGSNTEGLVSSEGRADPRNDPALLKARRAAEGVVLSVAVFRTVDMPPGSFQPQIDKARALLAEHKMGLDVHLVETPLPYPGAFPAYRVHQDEVPGGWQVPHAEEANKLRMLAAMAYPVPDKLRCPVIFAPFRGMPLGGAEGSERAPEFVGRCYAKDAGWDFPFVLCTVTSKANNALTMLHELGHAAGLYPGTTHSLFRENFMAAGDVRTGEVVTDMDAQALSQAYFAAKSKR